MALQGLTTEENHSPSDFLARPEMMNTVLAGSSTSAFRTLRMASVGLGSI